jgi:hypothetical protein
MRYADTAQDRRDRLTALLRAGLLAALALVVLPLPAFAADPGPDPSGDGPSAEATSDPTPAPTPDPTAAPTPDPTPAPAPDPTLDAGPAPKADPSTGPEPTPSPDPTASPSPGPTPTPPPDIVSKLLYRSSAITRQYRNYWCVPAAVMTMLNLVNDTSDTRWARQNTLYNMIRKHNRYRYRTNGNDIQGWAWAMRFYGGEPYVAKAYTSKTTAIKSIVSAIDRTDHPVGITVHHGTHAWIVLGYKARPSSTDPSVKTILGFYVTGPLGPGSSDPWRYRYYSMATFRKVYGRYHESSRKVIWEGKYVLVSE